MDWQEIYEKQTLPYYQGRREKILAEQRKLCSSEARAIFCTELIIEFLAEDDARTLAAWS